MINSAFEGDYFKKTSTYGKFTSTGKAVAGLSNYYFGLFRLVSQYFPKGQNRGQNVLEVGCGYSGLVERFLDDGFNYTGLDISNYITEELSQKYPHVTFVQHDIQLPLPWENKFDLILGLEVLEHVGNPEAALKNLTGALTNGGVLIASVPNPESRIPFTDFRRDPTHVSVLGQDAWVSLFGQAGLSNVVATTIFSLPYLWHFGSFFSRFFSIKKFGASILIAGYK